jgi:ABC-type phosphate/phosphonate transport system permease subunit
MRDRRVVPWLIGMGALALLATALAVVLIWWASELQVQVYEFYSTNPQVVDQNDYAYWERVGTNAYTLQTLAMPLFLAALVAVFALLAVLARREDAHATRAAQAEAPAAS